MATRKQCDRLLAIAGVVGFINFALWWLVIFGPFFFGDTQ